jgi:hypothetical protein
MGFLDALTADAFPLDSQGRRVLTPYGARGKAFILPPERVGPLTQFQRRFFQAYVVALLVGGLAVGPWAILVVSALWMAGFFVGITRFTRGLEETSERPTRAREERVGIFVRAMGRPTMYVVCLAGAASAVGGAWLIGRGQQGPAIWFLTLYGLVIAILYAWRLAQAPSVPPTS